MDTEALLIQISKVFFAMTIQNEHEVAMLLQIYTCISETIPKYAEIHRSTAKIRCRR